MEITLEKIELVKDRTGVSYAEAKEALEAAEGSVVDAIISIEEKIDEETSYNFTKQGNAVIENLKALVKKGNVSKIVIKRDDEVMLNIPVNLGILGTVIAPWGAVLGVLAAFGTKCSIELVGEDGTIIDVSDTVSEKVGSAVEKGSAVAGEVKSKSAEFIGEVKEKSTDIYESAKEKASDVIDKVKGEAEEFEFDFEDEEDDEFEIEIVEEGETEEVKNDEAAAPAEEVEEEK